MSYYTVIAAMAILIVGLNGKPITLVANEPKRCCVPKQFSSQMSTSNGVKLPDGTTIAIYGYYNYSYDADRGMVGMKGVAFSIPDQQKSNLWIIENMNDGQIYTIDQDSKRCYKGTMPIKPLHCIPDTATYLHSFTYGYDNKQIIGDTWLVKIDQTINYATVSRDGLCVPLTGHIFLQNPAILTAVTTTDFAPNIDDPSIFDIPSECNTVC
ncbi:unnamed protein product [Rotaria sp. Silwood1]|nr:unnamed protein product [Rotaria sp. Silwood1]CAF1540980.1 unnamed protein product [Rotaria sp. Silwood1]CAF3599160.1 unnamed protein product [Rotaria sp. Silwood1]